ncbi:Hypothetical predicted protein [Octopus vulgaris]|uniref:SPIN-DOC-like zinc-finger domain-containing protein n=1 Tax=Octopus vulgaris TaxID=6645 RepID=A0AA36FE39_OCTVU|nr:Hypothetical predicted protein [Octopus vulgaris]
MAKRKVNAGNRSFQIQWETEYMFIDIDGKPMCLNCGANVAVIKEYNLKCHHKTKHQDQYKYLTAEQKQRKVDKLKRCLTLQQTFLTKAKSQREAAIKASFIVAEKITKLAQPFLLKESL